MTQSILDQFYEIGIIPVLEIDSVQGAVPLAEALLAGGLPVAEVTMRTGAAVESIHLIANEVPQIMVGAGTVTSRDQAEAARDAGAQYLVSPGIVEEVVVWAQENQIPMIAGAVTPTEIMHGIRLGLHVLKFFPAETMGGLKAIESMSDPFPGVRFIPTGGIRPENASQYLQHERIHAVGGSWMAKRQMIVEGNFDEIKRLAKEASNIVKQSRTLS